MREEHFATPDPIRFECSVTAGDIMITTADDGDSTVLLDGPPELVNAMQVEMTGDRLVISEPRGRLADLVTRPRDSLQLRATVPHGSAVLVKTESSDAALDGAFGPIEMQSASADLRVTGAVDGDITVKSASGDVHLPDVCGDVNVRGVSGDLHADSIDGSVTVTLVSGDVRIEIAPGSAVDLDATTASGDLISEVPLSDAPDGASNPMIVIRGVTASGDLRVFRATHAPAL
jgi:hypothetical protein